MSDFSPDTYRNVVDEQSELICRFLPCGKLTFANRAYCEYFGVSCQEILGKDVFSLIENRKRDKLKKYFDSLGSEKPIGKAAH